MEIFVIFFLKRCVKNVLIFYYNWWIFVVRYINVYIDMYRIKKKFFEMIVKSKWFFNILLFV